MNNPTLNGVFLSHIESFIHLKHNLGYKASGTERSLKAFDRFAKSKGVDHISISESLAKEWCTKRKGEANDTWSHRITFLKQFCIYLFNLGFDVYIPQKPPSRRDETFIPYIFTDNEKLAIFNAVDSLRLFDCHMNGTLFIMPALIRMLASTGLRIGEALALKKEDVHLEPGIIIVRKSKNGKERIVPFTSSLSKVITQYLLYRNILPCLKDDLFFIKPNGESAISLSSINYWWHKVLKIAKIPLRGMIPGPRMYDLRHTFCVCSMKKMTQEGKNLYYTLPVLSTYIGHSSIASTDRYVRMTADMYPDLIGKTESICSYIFPRI